MENKEKMLRIVCGDVTFGVHGDGFSYIFSYACGGPESLVTDGEEWLYRAPRPTFWRALTDNDRGSGFAYKSGMWLAADLFLRCTDSRVRIDGGAWTKMAAPANNRCGENDTAGEAEIAFVYETITIPAATVEVAYRVNGEGQIRVDVRYCGREGLPELPVFGMRFVMPSKACGYRYEGLSGETYPDRMAGGVPGVYEVAGLPVTGYLVPQDCGVHMDTKWLEVYRDTKASGRNTGDGTRSGTCGLRFGADGQPFAFSCLPYTAEELENATHIEELPAARRTVVSILGAVRGVGGINSWGADVEDAYRIDGGKDIRYSFVIERGVLSCRTAGGGEEADPKK